MKTCLVILLLSLELAAAVAAGKASGTERGMASWYGAECSKTASGEHYDPASLTAAHRSLPFGTLVQVRNLSTGCAATVRINDRGPRCKGRIIDVSEAAARKLKMKQSGTAKVELVVLQFAER